MRISTKLSIVLFGLFAIGIGSTCSYCAFVGCRFQTIESYDECVANDFPVVASNPPRCIVNEEIVFMSRAPSREKVDTVPVTLRPKNTAQNNSISSTEPKRSNEFDPLSQFTGELPPSVRLEVPFAPQAPFANWDAPFNEACEESSLLMAQYFMKGDDLSLQQASNEIIQFVDWQAAQGYNVDVSIRELAEAAESYYSIDTAVYKENQVSIESIQKLLSLGYPVIVPAAGHMLENPYFRGAGPPYHMLVITGYDAENFITNDPGTKRGKNYAYDQEKLFDAIHDWHGAKDTIKTGPKAMLVVRAQ